MKITNDRAVELLRAARKVCNDREQATLAYEGMDFARQEFKNNAYAILDAIDGKVVDLSQLERVAEEMEVAEGWEYRLEGPMELIYRKRGDVTQWANMHAGNERGHKGDWDDAPGFCAEDWDTYVPCDSTGKPLAKEGA